MAIGGTFGKFFNDSDLDQIEGFINGILSTPDVPRENDQERISSDFLSNFFEKDSDSKEKGEIDQLFNQFNVPTERVLRYSAYDEIYRSVSIIRRIVKVYKANIIQKNPVNGLWYLLRRNEFLKDLKPDEEQKAEDAKEYFVNVIKSFNIANKLKNLYLHDTLIYGDSYLEVVDFKKESEKIDIKKLSIINETQLLNDVNKFNKNTPDMLINEAIDSVAERLYSVVNDSEDEKDNSDESVRFKNILIRIHKPHNIIILETKYGTKIGYLEVIRDPTAPINNLTQTLTNITNRIVSLANEKGSQNYVTSRDSILNKIANYILKKVTTKEVKYDQSVIDSFKRFIVEQNIHRQQINLKPVEVRFIPVSRMIPFTFPSSENYPYGGSLIETLMLPGKLFILSQLSNIYMKLSRAPITRKWIIDQGSVQMSGQLIQKLKREIRNNRIAVEDIGSFKNVSKIMSDYKDFFILSKNGQRALDVEVTPMGDNSVKIADLEDARREIIALSGIPAPLNLAAYKRDLV
jgi:hypothetical protein